MTTARSRRYYIRSGQQVTGPVDLAGIGRLLESRRVGLDAQYSVDRRQWRPLRELPGLTAAEPAVTQPSVPPPIRPAGRPSGAPPPLPGHRPVPPPQPHLDPHAAARPVGQVLSTSPLSPYQPRVHRSGPGWFAAGIAAACLVMVVVLLVGNERTATEPTYGVTTGTDPVVTTSETDWKTVGLKTSEMDFHAQQQQGMNWCWAACIQMTLSSFGVYQTQEEIVRRTKGAVVDEGGYDLDILKNLIGWRVTRNGEPCVLDANIAVGGPPTVAFMKDQLDREHPQPVIVAYRPPGQLTGHAVVITAITYRVTSTGPVLKSVIVRDPAPQSVATRGRREFTMTEFDRIDSYFLVVPL